MNIQTKLTRNSDIVALMEADLGPAKQIGRWFMFHCPFPGHSNGDRNPSLGVTLENGRWHCFTCGKHGDLIGWLMQFHELSFNEAKKLNTNTFFSTQKTGFRQSHHSRKSPPDLDWQYKARQVITRTEDALWTSGGNTALAYLHERGLRDETIQKYHLGLSKTASLELPQTWGLPETDHKVWLPDGITIPTVVNGVVWGINVRRFNVDPKYQKITGSKTALFGAENLLNREIGLLCEGEFDCIIADQEAGDVIGFATLGSASQQLDLLNWGPFTMRLHTILVAYDNDNAGDKGANSLLALGSKMKRIRLPDGPWKDINDFYLKGGNLRKWFEPFASGHCCSDMEPMMDGMNILVSH